MPYGEVVARRSGPNGLLGVEGDVVGSAGEDHCSAGSAGIGGAGGAAGRPRHRRAVPTPRWSAPRPGTARRCCSRTGHAPAPDRHRVRHRLGEPGPRRQRPEAVVDRGSGRARRLPVGATGQPPARPLGVATRHPAGVPRRTRRRRAGAAPADPADPRRRARTRRPGRPARPAHPARNRPTGLQLVLSSRFDPPLSLPRLRLTGRLCELRAERLRSPPPRRPPCSNDPA